MKHHKFSQASENRFVGVDEDIVKVCHRALELCPIDFGIPPHGGYRDAMEQNDLFIRGASKCDGFKNKSYHQSGRAIDVYAYVDGAASWKVEHLTTVAVAMMQAASEQGVRMEWGGFFKSFKDMPHFQKPKEDV